MIEERLTCDQCGKVIEERLTCDQCGKVIERYSPYPDTCYFECVPIPNLHSGMVYSVATRHQDTRHIHKDCFIKMEDKDK